MATETAPQTDASTEAAPPNNNDGKVSNSTSSSSLTATESDASSVESPQQSVPEDLTRLLQRVDEMRREDQLLAAARLLKTLPPETIADLEETYQTCLKNADEMEHSIADLVGPADDEWNKQSSSSGKRPTIIYNKFDEDKRLTCRIETPIETSLLVPLLSVLNETDLYQQWIPSWRIPTLGVAISRQLHLYCRSHQVVQILCDTPWPMRQRELIVNALSLDDINEQGIIVTRLNTIREGEHVPPCDPDVVRVDMEGCFLFRICPDDHECLLKQTDRNEDEPQILFSFKLLLDSKVTVVPLALINFITKTVIGTIWNMLLRIAEDVRDGNRPDHKKAIEERADLYKWIESRIEYMEQEAKKKKEQEEAIKKKEQEEASKKDDQEEASKKEEQEEASKKEEQEEASKKDDQEDGAEAKEEAAATPTENEEESP